MSLFDSHAHLAEDQVYEHVDAIVEKARSAGVNDIINICTDPTTLSRGLDLAVRYPWIRNAAATTPHDVQAEGESVFPLIEKHAKQGDLVAIGETGLDYFHHHSPKETQQLFLKRYLRLALECHLPVIIHCRDAFSDFFRILDEEYVIDGKHAPGVLHCFTGSEQEAEEVIKRSWCLSLSGIVTFKKSEVLREVAKRVPLDQLLIETDTPYLAPQSRRGKVNEPAYIAETAAVIAACRGVEIGTVVQATTNNAKRLFGI